MMNEKGMILPTVLMLMLALAGLLTGTAFIMRNQVQQLTLTQDSYTMKTMVELSEQVFREQLETTEASHMIVHFNEGRVEIKQLDTTSYQFVASLPNGMQYEKKLVAEKSPLESEEETEEELIAVPIP